MLSDSPALVGDRSPSIPCTLLRHPLSAGRRHRTTPGCSASPQRAAGRQRDTFLTVRGVLPAFPRMPPARLQLSVSRCRGSPSPAAYLQDQGCRQLDSPSPTRAYLQRFLEWLLCLVEVMGIHV